MRGFAPHRYFLVLYIYFFSGKGVGAVKYKIPKPVAQAARALQVLILGFMPSYLSKDEWRSEAPPLLFGVLCPRQTLRCYRARIEGEHL